MSAYFTIGREAIKDASEIAVMVGELLTEIMNAIGVQTFNVELTKTTSRLNEFLDHEKYFVFVARSGSGGPAGFLFYLKAMPYTRKAHSAPSPCFTFGPSTA